jgi:thiol-disulfide isomerase/thioredoxin
MENNMKGSFQMSDVLVKVLSALAVFCLGAPVAAAEPGLPPLTHGLTKIAPGISAPPLRLPDLDEEVTDLTDFRGKVVVVNFWATWCPPCRREMPSLERLKNKMENEGVTVLAVNIGEDADTVFSFLGTIEPSPTFPLLFDDDAASLDDWGVKGLPTTFVVSPNGSVAYRAVGGREFDHPEILQQLRQLRKSPSAQ